jgi:Pyruvate/2-oxoacid:ferredoxin oxidoreductase delta subunit
VEIYYHSGTGNSLHVAKELGSRIADAKLIPMVSLLCNEKVSAKSETVGFIFPMYLGTLPRPVDKFIKRINLETAKYIFAIETRGGAFSDSFVIIDKTLQSKQKSLNSCFHINMPLSNGVLGKYYKKPTKDQLSEIEMRVQEKINDIQTIISNKENKPDEDIDITIEIPLLKRILLFPLRTLLTPLGFNIYEGLPFYSDQKCKGCGICEKICLSTKIRMVNNRPNWQKNITCYSCFACINYCPAQSIQIESSWLYKSFTAYNDRYVNPYVKANEIAQQKSGSDS